MKILRQSYSTKFPLVLILWGLNREVIGDFNPSHFPLLLTCCVNGGFFSAAKKKSTHIKKPLNAFMLYMKEMRAKVVQEYTLKESAAINQILGKRVRMNAILFFRLPVPCPSVLMYV